MSGHTPGKWSIRFDKGHIFSDGTVDHGGYRIDADGVEQLAYVWNFSDRVDPVSHSQDGTRPFGAHEAEANARLIAASPMLLEALKPIAALRKHFTSRHGTRPTSGAIAAWHTAESSDELTVEHLIAAVEAIAAATGETP